MTKYNPQKIEESGTAFVTYQDELKEIWRDNVTFTKSLVLFQEEHGNGDVEASEHCCHYHQFIAKFPEWISKKRGS